MKAKHIAQSIQNLTNVRSVTNQTKGAYAKQNTKGTRECAYLYERCCPTMGIGVSNR
jgi:hypothetical protein